MRSIATEVCLQMAAQRLFVPLQTGDGREQRGLGPLSLSIFLKWL